MLISPLSGHPKIVTAITMAINKVQGCRHEKTHRFDEEAQKQDNITILAQSGYETIFSGWLPTLHKHDIRVATFLFEGVKHHFKTVKSVLELQQLRSDFAASIGFDKPIKIGEKDDPFFDRIVIDRWYARQLVAKEKDPTGYLHDEVMRLYGDKDAHDGNGKISKGWMSIIEHQAGLVEYLMRHEISSRSQAIGNLIAVDHEAGKAIPDAAFSAAIGRPIEQFIELPNPYSDYYANRIIVNIRKPLPANFFYIELEKDFVTFGDLKG